MRLCCPWDSPGKNTGAGCHFLLQCMKVKSESEDIQSCPTLSDPMDCSAPGSPIHGIFQARVLEWGAIAFSEICLLQTFMFFNIPLPPPQMILMCSCTLDDQNIFLICIFGLRPWFLAHSSQNSWNFLSKKEQKEHLLLY